MPYSDFKAILTKWLKRQDLYKMTYYMCFEESFTFSYLLTLVGWLLYHLSFCPIPNSVDGITCDWFDFVIKIYNIENILKKLLNLFQNPAVESNYFQNG